MPKTILHISADFPDDFRPQKTKAISGLIDATPDYRHIVYSLNRMDGISGITARRFDVDRTSIIYRALPKGIMWNGRLRAVARFIKDDLATQGITPDLIYAHKLTVEGIAGLYLSKAFSCPLVCDVQGGSDAYILRSRFWARQIYKKIAAQASLFFFFAPWAQAQVARYVQIDNHKCQILPVLPENDTLSPAPLCTGQKIMTMFHRDHYRNKNIDRLIRAIMEISRAYPHIRLDIYGGGAPQSAVAITAMIVRHRAAAHVKLMGAIENARVHDVMKEYTAFAMPSLRETYGLVFAEALFAGIPVIYPKDRAIEGYFDPGRIGYACDPYDVHDIARGIEHVIIHETAIKDSITDMQVRGDLDVLRRHSILDTYRQGLGCILQNATTNN